MQGGTAATQEVFIENVGQPTLACIRPAVDALQDLNSHREVQLVISGGIRNGADVAKALALGADAVSIGSAAMIAIGDNDPKWEKEYEKLGSKAGAYDDWHEGNDPAGISTQKPELMKRLDPKKAGRKLSNYLLTINNYFFFIPGIQLVPAKGTLAIAAASTVNAHKSSGSKL